jgi:hypothetical protein
MSPLTRGELRQGIIEAFLAISVVHDTQLAESSVKQGVCISILCSPLRPANESTPICVHSPAFLVSAAPSRHTTR